MTVFRKAALSLLIAIVLVAGIAVFVYSGLFSLVETRFYNPSITRSLTRQTAGDAQTIQEWLADLQSRFAGSLNEIPVRNSFLHEQSTEDIFVRSRIFGMLMESVEGLQSVRFVDLNGRRIHFSTHAPDILVRDQISIIYRNYSDDADSLPFEHVQVLKDDLPRLAMDSARDRIIFSFPFHDAFDMYRGTALFSVSARALVEQLIRDGRIKATEDIMMIDSPPGIICGSSESSKKQIAAGVSEFWNVGLLSLTSFSSSVAGISLALISAKTSQGVFYGRLVNKEVFSFSPAVKTLLMLSMFCTIFLTTFFCFNFKQDGMMIIQNRLKELQIALITQFYESKGEMDWNRWIMELEQRREGVRSEVKKGVRLDNTCAETDIDLLIDKSWDEMLALLGSRRSAETGESGIDEEKLRLIVNGVLQRLSGETARLPDQPAEPEELEGPEELEELESVPEGEVSPVELLPEETAVLPEAAPSPGEAALPEVTPPPEFAAGALHPAEPEKQFPKARGLLAAAALFRGAEQSAPEPSGLELFEEIDIELIETVEDSEEPEILEAIEDLEVIEDTEEPEGLEEIGELEAVEEPETAGSPFGYSPLDSAAPETGPRVDASVMASRIEFSEEPAGENENETSYAELEIVSPFSSMLASLSGVNQNLEFLEAIEENDSQTPSAVVQSEAPEQMPADAIQERDGIPYINSGACGPGGGTEEKLDQGFKDLIAEVVKRPPPS